MPSTSWSTLQDTRYVHSTFKQTVPESLGGGGGWMGAIHKGLISSLLKSDVPIALIMTILYGNPS